MQPKMETLSVLEARRLALARAGLLNPDWTGLPRRAKGAGKRARRAAHAVIRHFGYLQLDTVSVAGARSHVLVLLSRLEGFAPELGEALLAPGEPLFEFWGHEVCWLPIELYPVFEFRRREYQDAHPWWGDLLGEHPDVARRIVDRIRDEGPLRSVDLEGRAGPGMWNLKLTKKVVAALWSAGELAVRERRNFHRAFDLTERVVPEPWRRRTVGVDEALRRLLLLALEGHGWAATGTLASTWRLRKRRPQIDRALAELVEQGRIVPCALREDGKDRAGWVRPADLELAARLRRVRPRRDRGVLLSPFDPVLWDRPRVRQLFGFEQLLEIFKPAAERRYGYYCLPVLAGDRLVARVDLKADRAAGVLPVLSRHYEDGPPAAETREALRSGVDRLARALDLSTVLGYVT